MSKQQECYKVECCVDIVAGVDLALNVTCLVRNLLATSADQGRGGWFGCCDRNLIYKCHEFVAETWRMELSKNEAG